MKILDVQQGTDAWHAERAARFTASEAAAMMGASPYMTRDELLHMKATGIAPEVNPEMQRRFDDGHRAEASAREIIEKRIGELYPVTAVHDERSDILASFDGITMMEDITFEHKLYGEKIAEKVRSGAIKDDPSYYWQLEQQLFVSGAEKAIFVASDGTEENWVECEYSPVRGRKNKLLSGWDQFAKDLEEYKEKLQAGDVKKDDSHAVGEVIGDLPMPTYKIEGTSITTNTAAFSDRVKALVAKSKACEYKTDQDFADAEVRIKAFKAGEDKARTVADMIINEVTDIAAARQELLELAEMMRTQRLADDKQVKSRKESIKGEIASEATANFLEHVRKVEATLPQGCTIPPAIRGGCNPAASMKGKKTIAGLRSAANDEAARAKIAVSEVADHIRSNFDALKEAAGDYGFLFKDIDFIITKDRDDLLNMAKQRIAEYQEEQRKKEEREAAEKAAREAESEKHEAEENSHKHEAEEELHHEGYTEGMKFYHSHENFNTGNADAKPDVGYFRAQLQIVQRDLHLYTKEDLRRVLMRLHDAV